jgi:hypothetical protein
MDICLLRLPCLCVGLITRLEQSYRMWCVLIVIVKPRCRVGKDQITGKSAIGGKNVPTKCWCPAASLHCVKTSSPPK